MAFVPVRCLDAHALLRTTEYPEPLCHAWVLPTTWMTLKVTSEDITPWRPFGALARFFPKDCGLTSGFKGSTRQLSVAMQLQQRGKFRGCSHSITFKLLYLLGPPVAPTTEHI